MDGAVFASAGKGVNSNNKGNKADMRKPST
jgi:hypothetical protein